jgi:peptide deformylase
MALLEIFEPPAPVLRKIAEPVDKVDDAIRALLSDMLETMYEAPGIGLAAPQVGVSKRMLVMDISGPNERNNPLKIINPEIIWQSDDLNICEEGCLSVPGSYAEVKRPKQVKVKYLDENGTEQLMEADDLLATCIQHEIDHLNGILFIDHLSTLKKNMILRKLKKAQS